MILFVNGMSQSQTAKGKNEIKIGAQANLTQNNLFPIKYAAAERTMAHGSEGSSLSQYLIPSIEYSSAMQFNIQLCIKNILLCSTGAKTIILRIHIVFHHSSSLLS